VDLQFVAPIGRLFAAKVEKGSVFLCLAQSVAMEFSSTSPQTKVVFTLGGQWPVDLPANEAVAQFMAEIAAARSIVERQDRRGLKRNRSGEGRFDPDTITELKDTIFQPSADSLYSENIDADPE
jgi:hypothetical protein